MNLNRTLVPVKMELFSYLPLFSVDGMMSLVIEMEELIQCCSIMVELLTSMKDTGEITQKEYERHIALKIAFLRKYRRKNILSN